MNNPSPNGYRDGPSRGHPLRGSGAQGGIPGRLADQVITKEPVAEASLGGVTRSRLNRLVVGEEEESRVLTLELENTAEEGIEEEQDYLLLPKIEQAVEWMLRDSIESDTLEDETRGAACKFETGERRRGGVGSREDLGEGERIVGNDQTSSLKPSLEGNEIVEAAAMDNRFMKIIIGGETYMALFDPGATISLVGSQLAKRFEQ